MDRTALFKHLLSLLIFGTNGTLASYIKLPSYGIVLCRTILAFATLLIFFRLTKHHFSFMQHKKDIKFIMLSGIIQATEWLLMYEAFRHIDVGVATLLVYLGPVIVIALSPFIFKERLTLKKLFYMVIVLIGVVFLNRQAGGSGNIKFGLICAILAAFCYAGMVIFNKKSVNIVGFENSVIQLFFCCSTAVVYTLLKTGGRPPLPEPCISQWLLVLYLGTVNTGFTCFLYFSTLAKLPAQVIAVCGYLEPLFAIVFSSIILHETLTPLQLLGCAMIIGGAACCILAKEKEKLL